MALDIRHMTLTRRLEAVLGKAAALLPGEAAQQLRVLITPEALGIMAVVTGLWVASHLVGVGFLADLAMIGLGILTIGTAAIEGSDKLVSFAIKTERAKNEADLNAAARDLADAVTLLGISAISVLLLRGGPRGAFKTHFKPQYKAPTYGQFKARMPPAGPFRMYKPVVTFTRDQLAFFGKTDNFAKARIGRDFGVRPAQEAFQDVRGAVYHEQVHQWITAGFSLLGRPGLYLRWNAYKRSFILRYLEEAAAETRSQVLMRGIGSGNRITAYKFPFDTRYEITLTQIRAEANAILLGPVTVGGTAYQAYFGPIKQ